ncbi:MAG: DinB family protein [Ekhidna sp.]
MNRFFTLISSLILTGIVSNAQTSKADHYYEIPDYPASYTAESVAARQVDGLGFRYYWGSADLRESDLQFQPSDSARTIQETLEHIYVLTQIMANAVNEKPFEGLNMEGLTYTEIRAATLLNIRMASEKLKKSEVGSLEKYDMVFASSGSKFPFWNLLNGPIADAINHVGQVISMRRTNGNPYNQNVSVLRGTVKDQ